MSQRKPRGVDGRFIPTSRATDQAERSARAEGSRNLRADQGPRYVGVGDYSRLAKRDPAKPTTRSAVFAAHGNVGEALEVFGIVQYDPRIKR